MLDDERGMYYILMWSILDVKRESSIAYKCTSHPSNTKTSSMYVFGQFVLDNLLWNPQS